MTSPPPSCLMHLLLGWQSCQVCGMDMAVILRAVALPFCCRYLPMVAGDLPYCPEHYAAFPHAFQRTARALLLINECRGFGVLSVASRAEVGAGSGEAQGWSGVRLPMGELLHILGLAAKPLHVWQGL